jgi:hypothetical protein
VRSKTQNSYACSGLRDQATISSAGRTQISFGDGFDTPNLVDLCLLASLLFYLIFILFSVCRDIRLRGKSKIKFSVTDCRDCPMKMQCTTAPRRAISIRTKEHHQALQAVRARQKDGVFWKKYRARSGIEGTISESACGHLVCAGRAIVEWRKPISNTQ